MPADFQKAIQTTLIGVANTYFFLDDILIVSKGGFEEHKSLVRECLKKIDGQNLTLNRDKCHFANKENE